MALYQRAAVHKSVAILPFDMTLNLNKAQQKIITEKDKSTLTQTLSIDLQKRLYNHLNQYFVRKKLQIELQNTDKTLAILSENKITFNDLRLYNKTNIQKMLGVDAIIDPKMIVTQKGVAFSGIAPLPYLGIVSFDVYNLFITFSASLKEQTTDTALWKFYVQKGFQAANKIKKSKVETSDNFLLPLFLNVDDLFNRFIEEQPYRKLKSLK